MTETTMTESKNVTNDNAVTTPGQCLQAAREAAGFSVQYVAEQLRLTESYIAWLETDQYEHLPTEPFVLGYYRAYARILSLSADELIDIYHQYRGQLSKAGDEAIKLGRKRDNKVARKESQLDAPVESSNGNRIYLIAAAVLVFIWIAVSLLSGEQLTETSMTSQSVDKSMATTELASNVATENLSARDIGLEVDPDERLATSPINRDEVADPLTSEAEHQVNAAAPEPESAVAELSVDATASTEQAVSIQSASNGLDQLMISFGDECWLEITDAQGDVVAANLYQKDDVAKIQGVAPFTVMLGNVRAANMTVNNIAVAANPRGFRKTLRLSVYADGSTKTLD